MSRNHEESETDETFKLLDRTRHGDAWAFDRLLGGIARVCGAWWPGGWIGRCAGGWIRPMSSRRLKWKP
jgi:hypothetical protein